MLLTHPAALFQTTATTLKLGPMFLLASKLEVFQLRSDEDQRHSV